MDIGHMQTKSQNKLASDFRFLLAHPLLKQKKIKAEDVARFFFYIAETLESFFDTKRILTSFSSFVTPFIDTYLAANVQVDKEAEASNKSSVVSLDKGEASRGYLQGGGTLPSDGDIQEEQ